MNPADQAIASWPILAVVFAVAVGLFAAVRIIWNELRGFMEGQNQLWRQYISDENKRYREWAEGQAKLQTQHQETLTQAVLELVNRIDKFSDCLVQVEKSSDSMALTFASALEVIQNRPLPQTGPLKKKDLPN